MESNNSIHLYKNYKVHTTSWNQTWYKTKRKLAAGPSEEQNYLLWKEHCCVFMIFVCLLVWLVKNKPMYNIFPVEKKMARTHVYIITTRKCINLFLLNSELRLQLPSLLLWISSTPYSSPSSITVPSKCFLYLNPENFHFSSAFLKPH